MWLLLDDLARKPDEMHPCLPVEYEDDEQEPPCVRKLDSLIAAGE